MDRAPALESSNDISALRYWQPAAGEQVAGFLDGLVHWMVVFGSLATGQTYQCRAGGLGRWVSGDLV